MSKNAKAAGASPRKNSIVLKSVKVTNDGNIINVNVSARKKPEAQSKPLLGTKAKRKELNERLQRAIEFSNEVEPCMIVQQAAL